MLGKHWENPSCFSLLLLLSPHRSLLKALLWLSLPRVAPASLCLHSLAICPVCSTTAALLFLEATRPPQGFCTGCCLCLEVYPDRLFTQTLNHLFCGTFPAHQFKISTNPPPTPPSLSLLIFSVTLLTILHAIYFAYCCLFPYLLPAFLY